MYNKDATGGEMKLLIADDEPMIRKGLMTLDWESINIYVCGVSRDGQETLALVVSLKPDIILIDINMPLISGLEVAKSVLAINPECKIIFLTGYSDFEYVKEALALQAFDYILKPTSPDEIISTVIRAIDTIKNEREERICYDITKKRIKQYINIQRKVEANSSLEDTEWQGNGSYIKRVVQFIQKNYMNDISLLKLSENLNLTQEYLCRTIKKSTGYTYLDIVTLIRMIKAVELFRSTEFSIAQVSESVGIHDQRYFSQLFKKTFKQTPSSFQKFMKLQRDENLLTLAHTLGL